MEKLHLLKKISLLDKYQMGVNHLSCRIGMAALTRMRADPQNGVPTDLHVKYYSERAEDAGFVLTECTAICPQGNSFPGACGIYSKEQIEGWKKVTEAVHKNKGLIYIQIWHCGRSAHSSVIGANPIAPSKIKNRGQTRNLKNEMVECSEPDEMLEENIKTIIGLFEKCAKNAKEAGFDGIELHGANGYLVDSFLRDCSNNRNDDYGGSIEKRLKFALEIIDKLISVFGSGRVGMKISPCGRLNDMFDSNPLELYKNLLIELGKRKVAFVEVMQPPDFRKVNNLYGISGEEQIPEIFKTLKQYFTYNKEKNIENNKEEDYEPTFIANNNLDFEKANELLDKGYCDMVTFGRLFISNPDLVTRLKNNYQLTSPSYETFYTPGEEGYITYKKYSKI